MSSKIKTKIQKQSEHIQTQTKNLKKKNQKPKKQKEKKRSVFSLSDKSEYMSNLDIQFSLIIK